MSDSGVLATDCSLWVGDGGAAASSASLSIGSGSANLTLTAVTAGSAGNSYTYTAIDPGADASLSVGISGTAITVNLAYGSGAITSTINDVIAALSQNSSIAAVVQPSSSGSGLGLATAVSATALSGGSNSAETFIEIENSGEYDYNRGSKNVFPTPSHKYPNSQLVGKVRSGIQISFPLFLAFDTQPSHVRLLELFESSEKANFRLVRALGSGGVLTFVGQVQTFPEKHPVDGAVTGDCTILITNTPSENI